MGRVARILTWLLATGAIALFALAVSAFRDATRVRDIMANGAETTAVVDGGKLGVRQVDDDTYVVDLTWQDADGTLRAAKGLAVVATLGRQLVAGEAGDPPALLIKYAQDAPGRAPVIVRQAALDQEANARLISRGAIGGGLCAIGAAVLALVGRRRRQGS
jgi:hypothetical protein